MRTHLPALAAGLLLASGLTACGGGGGGTDVESDPAGALSEAFDAFGEYDGVEVTLRVEGDRDEILAAAGDSADAIEILLDSSLTLRAAGTTAEDGRAEIVFDLDGTSAAEVRILPESQLFLRVDLDAIGTAVDDPEFASGLDQAVTMAEQFGLGEAATTLREGGWVEVAGLEQLAEVAGGGQTTPDDEEVASVQAEVSQALQDFLDRDVTVTYVGDEDAGEHVQAETTQAALGDLLQRIGQLAGELGGVGTDQLGQLDELEGGEEPVVLDVWLEDGRVSQLGYDLGSAGGEAPEGTYLLAGIAEFGGDVEAPADATAVDLFEVMGGFMGAGGGLDAGAGTEPETGADGAGDAADGGDATDAGAEAPEAECLPQADIDAAVEAGAMTEEDIQSLIEQGLIEVC